MAKETKVKAENTFKGDTEFSGWQSTDANPDVPTAPEDLFFRVERGTSAVTGKAAYRVEMKISHDGAVTVGPVLGSAPAAFNKTLEAMGLAKGAVTGDTGLKTLFPPEKKGDNKGPKVEVTEEELNEAESLVDAVKVATDKLSEDEAKTRASNLEQAQAVRDLRSEFSDKKKWAAIKADLFKQEGKVPDYVSDLLNDTNRTSYMVRFANMAANDALFSAMPEDIRTSRSFEKEIGIIRTAIASEVASMVNAAPAKRKDLAQFVDGLGKKGDSVEDIALAVLKAVEAEGADLPSNKSRFLEASKAYASAHLAQWDGAEGDIFTSATEDGVTRHQPSRALSTLFGLEGPDEMADAICKALNNYEAAKTIEEAKAETASEGAKALAKTIQAGNKFSGMSVEQAASHLLHILAGKLDEDAREASADEAESILAFMSERVADFRSGAIESLEDVYALPQEGEASTEDEAEDAADAA